MAEPEVFVQSDANGQTVFFAKNDDVIPNHLFISIDNMNQYQTIDYESSGYQIPAGVTRFQLFSIARKPGVSAGSLSWQTRFIPGVDPNTNQIDTQYIYSLPFNHGTKHKLTQGYFGDFTHHEPTPYALDFAMPEGTAVHAARDGIVWEVKEDSNLGGPTKAFADKGNHIILYHGDGSFSSYAHLKKDGALVNIGDRVAKGALIGLSGNTGYSSGPHLHYEVFKFNDDGSQINFPVKYTDPSMKPFEDFVEGYYYYATHEGKAKFEVELGHLINNSDIEVVTNSIAQTDKFDLRWENIDDTWIVYVQNGYREPASLSVEMTLNNLDSSNPLPAKIDLAPLEERFVTILKPKDYGKPGAFTGRVRQISGSEITKANPANDTNSEAPHNSNIVLSKSKRSFKPNSIQLVQQRQQNQILLFAKNSFSVAKSVNIRLFSRDVQLPETRLTVKLSAGEEKQIGAFNIIQPQQEAKLHCSYMWSY